MNRTKVEYQELRKALKKYDEKVMDKYDDLSINFKGCMTEELCYNDIKSYFKERKETVLVINGLFLQNREGNKNEGSEKDFIIVNYTLRYIMVVEVKWKLTTETRMKTSSVQKSSEQIIGALKVLRSWFQSDTDEFWYFVPLVYCVEMDENVAEGLKDKMPFVFCKSQNQPISAKFKELLGILEEMRGTTKFLPNPKSFKTLANYLIYGVSRFELPVKSSLFQKIKELRGKAGLYENILLWGFWNPTQQAIMNCDNLDDVILTGTYSVGKTTALTGRTLKLDSDGEKVLFINSTGHNQSKTLISLELEEQFKNSANVTFMARTQNEIHKMFLPSNSGSKKCVQKEKQIPNVIEDLFKTALLATFPKYPKTKKFLKICRSEFDGVDYQFIVNNIASFMRQDSFDVAARIIDNIPNNSFIEKCKISTHHNLNFVKIILKEEVILENLEVNLSNYAII